MILRAIRSDLFIVASLLLLVIFIVAMGIAYGRDGYDVTGRPLVCDPRYLGTWDSYKGETIPDEGALVRCRNWVSSATEPAYTVPKNLRKSCCGDGDAFIADAFDTKDGRLTAIITEDYSQWAKPKGTRVVIPPDRINRATEDKNPTDHGVVFIGSSGNVICYFLPEGK